MSETFFTVGERLREERVRLDLTQPAFGLIADASKRTVIDWEKGVSAPTATQLARLAGASADVLYIVTGQRSQALPPDATLPQDERALLDAYRACTPEARRNLIATAALLSAGMAPAAAPRAPAPAPTKMRMGDMVSNHAGSVQVGYAGGKVSVSTGGVKKSQKKAR